MLGSLHQSAISNVGLGLCTLHPFSFRDAAAVPRFAATCQQRYSGLPIPTDSPWHQELPDAAAVPSIHCKHASKGTLGCRYPQQSVASGTPRRCRSPSIRGNMPAKVLWAADTHRQSVASGTPRPPQSLDSPQHASKGTLGCRYPQTVRGIRTPRRSAAGACQLTRAPSCALCTVQSLHRAAKHVLANSADMNLPMHFNIHSWRQS